MRMRVPEGGGTKGVESASGSAEGKAMCPTSQSLHPTTDNRRERVRIYPRVFASPQVMGVRAGRQIRGARTKGFVI